MHAQQPKDRIAAASRGMSWWECLASEYTPDERAQYGVVRTIFESCEDVTVKGHTLTLLCSVTETTLVG